MTQGSIIRCAACYRQLRAKLAGEALMTENNTKRAFVGDTLNAYYSELGVLYC